jgi:prepilin-type N-terminal cleavage/methylation domain-containing protein
MKNQADLQPQRQTRTEKQLGNDSQGFTLIEVLMALVLVAILATIAIAQFTDFTRDAKNAALKSSLATLRNGIQKQYAQMRMRCGVSNPNQWPELADIQNNDITNTGNSCTTDQIPDIGGAAHLPGAEDRKFVNGGIPENPWSDPECTAAEKRAIVQAAETGIAENLPGTQEASEVGDALSGSKSCGWQYDDTTGRIIANSNRNGETSALAAPDDGGNESSW